MSRAYRIRVSGKVCRTLTAEDEIQTRLEILEVLPAEQMAELLAGELEGRGFTRDGSLLRRKGGGVTTTVDARTGTVTVRAEQSKEATVEGQRSELAYDDFGPGEAAVKHRLNQELQQELETQARQKQGELQKEATRKLEAELQQLGGELNQAVNRVTAEALKRKAGQLGRITEIREDESTGAVSITVEV